ncbi:Pyruvate carboxylase subunit A [uncultured archaeon]|nr:Pyruvate carboxylase subunit A [uncultured archaeon]
MSTKMHELKRHFGTVCVTSEGRKGLPDKEHKGCVALSYHPGNWGAFREASDELGKQGLKVVAVVPKGTDTAPLRVYDYNLQILENGGSRKSIRKKAAEIAGCSEKNVAFATCSMKETRVQIEDQCVVVCCRGNVALDMTGTCEHLGITRVIAVVDGADLPKGVEPKYEEGRIISFVKKTDAGESEVATAPWLKGFSGDLIRVSNYMNVEEIAAGIKKVIADKSKSDPSWAPLKPRNFLLTPGYGLWSENPVAIRYLQEQGFTVVSPNVGAFGKIGNKFDLRQLSKELGVPVLPSSDCELTFSGGKADGKKIKETASKLVLTAEFRQLAERAGQDEKAALISRVRESGHKEIRAMEKELRDLNFRRALDHLVSKTIEKNVMLVTDAEMEKFPIRVKGSAEVGGGRSHYTVRSWAELENALEEAYSTMSSLGIAKPKVMLELNLASARHIEINMVAHRDEDGRLVIARSPWFRDCSMQNANQKMFERTVHPDDYERDIALLEMKTLGMSKLPLKADVPEHLREFTATRDEKEIAKLGARIELYKRETQMLEKIRADSERIIAHTGTTGVFTMEFLVDEHQQHYILEANLRLQVEREISERASMIDGKTVNFAEIFFHVAAAASAGVSPDLPDLRKADSNGLVAWEVRICKLLVDPSSKWKNPALVSPLINSITELKLPQPKPWLHLNMQQIDKHFDPETGAGKFSINPSADSMFGIMIVTAETKEKAFERMREVLGEMEIKGPGGADVSTVPFYRKLFDLPEFREGLVDGIGPGIDFLPKFISYQMCLERSARAAKAAEEASSRKNTSPLDAAGLGPGISFTEFSTNVFDKAQQIKPTGK